MEYAFNATIEISYGYYECPECGSTFYGGGRSIHRPGCTRTDYVGTTYHYSKDEYDRWLEEVRERGYCANLPLSPRGLSNHFLLNALNGRDALCSLDLDEVKAITEKYVASVSEEMIPDIMKNLDNLVLPIQKSP